ncbi:MAG: TRAP transporter substrate-binding protein [Syntrophothermaceae bacterium]
MRSWLGIRNWKRFSRVGKRVVALMVAVVFMATSAGCSQTGSSPKSEGQKTVELRLAHFWPATHPAETELVQPWAGAIEEATAGKVKITSYPAQTLLPADGIYDGVVSGVADIGISCFSYTRGRFPVLEVFELPGITYNNSKVASKVAWEGIQELNPPEVQDTKLLMVLTTGPGDLYTKTPVRKLEDLKGLEIRATGLSAKTLNAVRATPVAMPQSEAYEALSKGVVKGNLGPVEVLQGWRQAEVTDYLTKTPFLYNTLFFVTMNRDKWDSLTPEIQKAIQEVSEEYFEKVAIGLWDKQNESALKFAVEQHNMEVIELSSAEKERWISLVKPIQDEFVARMDQEGFDGHKILQTAETLAQKYNQEYK